jgi:hypothetical protein
MSFKSRGLDSFTQGELSRLTILGKPRAPQLAHAGYSKCIEHFIYATATKKKISTSTDHVPIPDDYTPKFPLPLPKVIFKFARKPTNDQFAKIETALKGEGMEKVTLGKGEPCYTLSTPSFQTLNTRLPKVALAQCGVIESHAQMNSVKVACRIFQWIDLFWQRTHTTISLMTSSVMQLRSYRGFPVSMTSGLTQCTFAPLTTRNSKLSSTPR